jgi:DNA-binding NtrC family response regulator
MADVLVVEDDPDAGEALVDILKVHGHDVRIAFDGEHGLRLLHERIPDVVFLDVEMPILNGPGMSMRMLLGDAGMEKVPVVLLSGVPNLRSIAKRVGTPYFLSKPCTFAKLGHMLDRVVVERLPPTPDTV